MAVFSLQSIIGIQCTVQCLQTQFILLTIWLR